MGMNPLKHTPASHLYYFMDRFIFDWIRDDIKALLESSDGGPIRTSIHLPIQQVHPKSLVSEEKRMR